MGNNFITNTDSTNLHIVSHQGVALCNCHKQILDLLGKRLEDASAAQLFAEPVINEGENSIDWYTALPGRARPVSALPPEEQEAVQATFASQVAAIRKVATDLLASEDSSSVTKGNILDKALTWPDDNCLFACNDKPVLVCWGFSGNGLNAVQSATIDRDAAVRAAAVAPAAPATPQAEPPVPPVAEKAAPVAPPQETKRKGFAWWPLLLLIPLILLLLWLLSRCGAGNVPEPVRVGTPMPPIAASDTAQEPVVTAPDVVEDSKGEALSIPDTATDVSFMRGMVRVYTPLVNNAGQRVTVRAVLDEKGKGTAYIASGAQTCTGPAQAEYEPGMVKVTTEILQCPDGNNFDPIVMICKGQGELDCGLENSGKLLPVRAVKQDLQ